MIDIALFREQPEFIKTGLLNLGDDPTKVDGVVALDARRRELLTEVEALRAERNRVSKEIGKLKDKAERDSRIAEMRQVGDRIAQLEEELRQVDSDLTSALLTVPNLPHGSVPVGPDDSHNVVVRGWGEIPEFDFEPVPHWDLGPELDIIDFERGVKLSGSRFYVLRGAGARLQRALINCPCATSPTAPVFAAKR